MYKNLQNTITDIGIKNKDIALLLNKSDSYISKRINGMLKFDEVSMKSIYKFLKNKGYKGTKKVLFDYTKALDKEEKTLNETVRRINACMKRFKITNEQMAENLEVSPNTISAWRNGKVEKIGYDYIEKMAEIFNVTPVYLSGKYIVPNSYAHKDVDDSTVKSIDYQVRILNAVKDYEKSRGFDIETIDNECRKEMFFFNDDLIATIDEYYDLHFTSYRNIAIANKPKIDFLKAEIKEKRNMIELFENNEVYIMPHGSEGDVPMHILKQTTNDYMKDSKEELRSLEEKLEKLKRGENI